MNLRNTRGITLIALAITIGVLIIISFISIASLTSDNGIIKQTNVAKIEQIEGTAREQVGIGLTSMNLAILEARGRDNSYSAVANSSKIKAELIKTLNADKTGLNGEFTNAGTEEGDNATEIKIAYTGDDYKTACNDTNAQIVYTLTLNQRAVKLEGESSATLKDQNKNDVIIDVGGNTENKGYYLVDKVEIGDYVDIGIDYTNQKTFYPDDVSNTYASAGMTGWRVLSKSGSGDTGTVTLVSAGVPLCYYHPSGGVSLTSISNLSDLNKTLPQGTSSSIIGYTASGFENGTFNLASIWATNSKINASTAHAMTTNEIEAAYAELTETSKTILELHNMTYALITSNMTSVNSNMSSKAYDLLGIGMSIWLGGSAINETYLWYADYGCGVYGGDTFTLGVRPVVSLNAGVKIASDNTGTGESESAAYKLAY